MTSLSEILQALAAGVEKGDEYVLVIGNPLEIKIHSNLSEEEALGFLKHVVGRKLTGGR